MLHAVDKKPRGYMAALELRGYVAAIEEGLLFVESDESMPTPILLGEAARASVVLAANLLGSGLGFVSRSLIGSRRASARCGLDQNRLRFARYLHGNGWLSG